MKKKYLIAVLAGVLSLPAAGWAESLSGTITDIDGPGGRVTMLRNGTNESVSVRVSDQVMLSNLRKGSSVSLDAADRGSGNWEARSINSGSTSIASLGARSITPPASASLSTVEGTSGSLPAGVNPSIGTSLSSSGSNSGGSLSGSTGTGTLSSTSGTGAVSVSGTSSTSGASSAGASGAAGL